MNLSGIFRIGFVVNLLMLVFPALTSIILIREFDLIQIENYNFILAILTSSCAAIFSSFVQGNISNIISGNIQFLSIVIWNSIVFLLMICILFFLIFNFDLLEPYYWFLILGYLFLMSVTKLILNLCINVNPKLGLFFDLSNSVIPLISIMFSSSIIAFVLTTIVIKIFFNIFLCIRFELLKPLSIKNYKESKLIFKNALGYLSDSVINIGLNTVEKIVLKTINNFSFTISHFVNKATGPISSIIGNNNFWLVLFSRKNKVESIKIIYNYNLIIIFSMSLLLVFYKFFELEILNILLNVFNQKFNIVQLKNPIIFTLMGIGYSSIFNVFKRFMTALTNFRLMRSISVVRVVLLALFLFVIMFFDFNWTSVFLAWSTISFILVIIISFVFDKKLILLLLLSVLFNSCVYFFDINIFTLLITAILALYLIRKSFLKFNSLEW